MGPPEPVSVDGILFTAQQYVQYLHDNGLPPDPKYHGLSPVRDNVYPKLYYDNKPPETLRECVLRHQQSLPPPDNSQYLEDTVVSHANLSVVPPLIMDELVDAGDINMLLGCFSDLESKYNPLQKFQMVTAALFPLWLEMEPFFLDFPKDAEDGRKVLAALCDFITPFYPPPPLFISPLLLCQLRSPPLPPWISIPLWPSMHPWITSTHPLLAPLRKAR